MAKTKGKGMASEGIKARGFFRLQIHDQDGKVAGDTGWKENQITNLGFDQYLCQSLAGMTGKKAVAYAMLGTGGAPAATDTSLAGEITDVAAARCAVTPTTISSKTVQFAFTLNSSVYNTSHAISNVGLIDNSSTASAATIFAGNTFASSALATNQSVNGLTIWPQWLETIISKLSKLQESLIEAICNQARGLINSLEGSTTIMRGAY